MADKNLTVKDMSMVFEETCLTVKDVKKLLEKLPDDMIVVNDESDSYRPIGDISIETIDYCIEDEKIISGKVVGIY